MYRGWIYWFMPVIPVFGGGRDSWIFEFEASLVH